MQDITADYLRKHLGEVLDRAYYTGAEVRINRKGKAMGVFVPIALYEKRKNVYRNAFLKFMEEQRATGRGDNLSDEEAMDIATQTVNEVRAINSKQND
ncbi:MAG: type II toxin-antitoxin system Phd/YefM family antitoxin [Myxococcota bacterium]|nr:type II toxin-antitoxin system Phd/YefM family antitoxin [Myxococcota bacterium]